MNRCFIGTCGSGKTYALQENARVAADTSPWSFLVLDVNEEWPDARVWRGFRGRMCRVSSAANAKRKLDEGARVVLLTPGMDLEAMSGKNPFESIAQDLARIAIEGGPTVLVLPEAHQVVSEGSGPLKGYIKYIVHRWRHAKANVWWDTQNPQDVSKEMFRGTTFIAWFASGGWQDDAVLAKVSAEAAKASRFVTEHAEPNGMGCKRPGWHLRIVGQVCDGHAYKVTNGKLEHMEASALPAARRSGVLGDARLR